MFSCKRTENAREIIRNIDDLKGKKVVVCTGSTQDQFLEKHYPEITPFRVDFAADLIAPILSGQVSSGMLDVRAVRMFLKDNPNLRVIDSVIFSNEVAFSFKDTTLMKTYNKFIAALKETGELDRIIDKWTVNLENAAMPQLEYTGENGSLDCVFDISIPFVCVKNGETGGIDSEILSRFCAQYGYIPNLKLANFSSALLAMATKQVDVLCGGISVTEERKKQLLFADPHYSADNVLFTTIDKDPDYVPGSSSGTTGRGGGFVRKFKESFNNNLIRENRYLLILDGLKVTVLVTVLSALFGTLLGCLVCFMRMSRKMFFKRFSKSYIQLIRSIPQLVFLMLMFYVVFASSGLSGVTVAAITFAIIFSSYSSEVFRSAIENVDRGQAEAGVALGFSKFQTFVYIIAPQAVRQILPIYKGELVSLLKMTSVIGYIAVQDMTKASDIIRSRTFDAFFPLLFVTAIYFILAYLLTQSINLLERKFERHHQ